MMGNERAFQRSLRDVRKVGFKQALTATRALTVRKRRFSIRNRGFTTTLPFDRVTSKSSPASLVKQIGSALFKTAKGEAPFPIPGFGGTGRALQIRAIGRQQLARVPLPAKVIGGAVGITAATEALTGQSPIPFVRGRILGQIPFKKPSIPFKPDFPGGFTGGHKKMPRGLAVGQELPPSHQVVRVWQTFPGGPVFARLADGHIAVQKKDGTIKHFRPYRPVVIPRKWNARSMSRVATALKRQRKTATKIMQITGGMPKGRK